MSYQHSNRANDHMRPEDAGTHRNPDPARATFPRTTPHGSRTASIPGQHSAYHVGAPFAAMPYQPARGVYQMQRGSPHPQSRYTDTQSQSHRRETGAQPGLNMPYAVRQNRNAYPAHQPPPPPWQLQHHSSHARPPRTPSVQQDWNHAFQGEENDRFTARSVTQSSTPALSSPSMSMSSTSSARTYHGAMAYSATVLQNMPSPGPSESAASFTRSQAPSPSSAHVPLRHGTEVPDHEGRIASHEARSSAASTGSREDEVYTCPHCREGLRGYSTSRFHIYYTCSENPRRPATNDPSFPPPRRS